MAPITRQKARAIEHHTSSYLGKFPPEILNQIIGHLDKPSLKSLRLCSRLLKPLVEPRIYDKIVLDHGLERLRNAKSIIQDTRYRHYVKEVKNIWSLTEPKWTLDNYAKMGAECLLVYIINYGPTIPDPLKEKLCQICENARHRAGKYPYVTSTNMSAVLKEYSILKSRNMRKIIFNPADSFDVGRLICLNTTGVDCWQELGEYHHLWLAHQLGTVGFRLEPRDPHDQEVKVLKTIYAKCGLLEKISYSLAS